jgi:hypothetical protein
VTTREAHGTAASDGRREWLPRRARVGLRAAMDLWARKQGATGPMIRFFFQKKSSNQIYSALEKISILVATVATTVLLQR